MRSVEDNYIVKALKKRYFEVASKEDYPRTPAYTKEADHLEEAIRREISLQGET